MAISTPDFAKIKQCYEQEKTNPPVPRKFGDIPVAFESITAEWLTATLAKDKEGNRVTSVQLGPKDSGSFNRRRINMTWEGPDANTLPKSVFCKGALELINRLMLSNGGTRSEVTFYNTIRPSLDIETPSCHFAGYNPVSWASLIMLKDIPDAKFCNLKTCLSKTQFIEQFQLLAKLHGRFYLAIDDVVSTFATWQERFDTMIKNLSLESSCTNGFRAARPQIPQRLFLREAEVWPKTLKAVERNASLPQTLIHSDVHLGNWYITPEGHMGLTDWQVVTRGHWSRDVAYVLGTGVQINDRRTWEKVAVKSYLEALAAAGGPQVSSDEAWLEIRRQSLGALAYWTCTLRPSSEMPDMQPEDTSREMLARLSALVDDHDALDAFD